MQTISKQILCEQCGTLAGCIFCPLKMIFQKRRKWSTEVTNHNTAVQPHCYNVNNLPSPRAATSVANKIGVLPLRNSEVFFLKNKFTSTNCEYIYINISFENCASNFQITEHENTYHLMPNHAQTGLCHHEYTKPASHPSASSVLNHPPYASSPQK